MKKRLFIFLAVAMMMCLFALSVSADTLVPSDSNEYGELSVVDGVPEPTVIDKDAKTVVVVNEKYYTIPTYYLLADKSEFTWSVHANVKTALGLGSDVRGNLVRFEIPEGIETSHLSGDGGKKVEGATKLIEASIPTTLRVMGEHFFGKCTALTTVNGLENSKVDGIYTQAFYNTKITSISLPSTVKTIGLNAFRNTPITSIVIPDAVESIGDHAFASCTSLATITISENSNLKKFDGTYQFEQTIITSFYFPSSLESLGTEGAFYKCYSLETLINFENTKVTDIPNRAFAGPKFTTISFPKGIVSIGDSAFNGHKITGDIILPNTVTSLGDHAFAGSNIQMGKLVLGANLATITGTYTFEKSDFKAIYIPASITAFPFGAFKETKGTGAVYYYTGTLDQLNALLENTNSSDNGNFKNAEIVTLDEYNAIADTSKKNYIVYGLDKCETFYGGHTGIAVTDCTYDITCQVCNKFLAEGKEHIEVVTITYANGFTSVGVKTTKCANDGCTACDAEEEAPIIFTASGYSYKEDGKGIAGGFGIDVDAFNAYNNANLDNQISISLLIVNPKYLDKENSFFDADSKVIASQGAIQLAVNKVEYKGLNYMVSGFSLQNMQETELCFALVVNDGDSTQVVQKQYTGSDVSAVKASYTDVNGVSLQSVTVESIAPDVVADLKKKEEIL